LLSENITQVLFWSVTFYEAGKSLIKTIALISKKSRALLENGKLEIEWRI